MVETERRSTLVGNRRATIRGGRRRTDRHQRYPPVLLADRYEGVRRPCRRYLERLNFLVTEAERGDQVLEAIRTAPPRVIVTELALPKLPAPSLAAWLADHYRDLQIPIIVMADEPVDLPGTAGILVKPFPLAKLTEEIRRALHARPGVPAEGHR